MKKYLAMLLCLLAAVMLCAGASAEPMREVQSMDLNLHMDPLEVYAARAFGAEDFTPRAVDNLSDTEKQAYIELLVGLQAVAEGIMPETAENKGGMVSFPVLADYFETHKVPNYSRDEIKQGLKEKMDFDYFAVGLAMYTEHPELCFWTSETVSIKWYYYTDGTGTWISGISLGFEVGSSYRDSEDNLDVTGLLNGTQEFARVNTAKARARQIVDAGAGMTTDARLQYYADQICELNVYNSQAASVGKKYTNYFEPWKLVYVFDGDPNTNVVCEGYSKAFKYLCDLTGFADAEVICVSGDLFKPGGQPGGHMWNVVARPDGNYMVDVTNSEPENNWNGQLFMVHCEQGPEENMWFANGGLGYKYDDDTLAIHTLAELDVREQKTIGGSCGTNNELTWTLDEAGLLTISGDGWQTLWGSPEQVPWHPYRDQITAVRLSAGQHRIGDHDFENCSNLTEITIPEGIDEIGYMAFAYCGRLRSVTIPAGMKKIGVQAFQYTSLEEVNYAGSRADWEAITIYGGNAPLTTTIRFSESDCIHANVYVTPSITTLGDDLAPIIGHRRTCRDCGQDLGEHLPGMHTNCECCSCEHPWKMMSTMPVREKTMHNETCMVCHAVISLHYPGEDTSCSICGCGHTNTRIDGSVYDGVETHSLYCEDCHTPISNHPAGKVSDCPMCLCSHREMTFWVMEDGRHYQNCSSCGLYYGSHQPGEMYICSLCLMNGDFTDQVLALPASLTVLESEALAGTAADVILVPGSVTEIRSRAFTGCSHMFAVCFAGDPAVLADDFLDSGVDVTVICRPDTGIARWALAHNHMVSYY